MILRKKTLPVKAMIDLEEFVKENGLCDTVKTFTPAEMCLFYNLDFHFVEGFQDKIVGKLCPCENEYNGVIFILKNHSFLPEILTYLYYVGEGKKVEKEYIRDNSFSEQTLVIEYLKRAVRAPFDEVSECIDFYDSHTVDELAFVKKLSDKFGLSEKEIIKRIQNVRKVRKYRMKNEVKI